MGGGEHGDGQHRHGDGHDPAEDGEQEADEGQRRQQVGEHRAGDQQEPEHGGDEAVGDLPDGFEHVEALADEGNGFEQSRSCRRAHQCRHGGERRVHQAVAETEARSAMGLPLSATITLSRSMNSMRPAAMPPPPPGAGNAAAPLAAAENSMGW